MISKRPYPFVDWMKALGMCLIVYGHVAHATTEPLTPPIYLKQLGVVFFLFVTGFSLARERRTVGEVLVNRLFPVYLFGISCAALLSLTGLLTGAGLALSNYSPLVGGVNVVFNEFPANPTTWYLGTYLHVLLLWAVWLRRVRIRPWMVAAALLIEIPARGALIAAGRPFTAYMLLTNWIAVILLGMARGADWSEATDATEKRERRVNSLASASALVGGFMAWGIAMGTLDFDTSFPFQTFSGWPAPLTTIVVATSVSLLYLFAAACTFEATERLPVPAPVRFISRNTLIIFLAHMPVYFALRPFLVSWGLGYWQRVAVQLAVCLPGLALLSEAIVTLVRPKQLLHQLKNAFSPDAPLGEMFREQIAYRELLVRMTERDLLLRYKQTVMGFGWAIFMPLVNTAVFSVVFTRVAPIDVGVPYPVFAFCGLLVWNFFASALRFSVTSLTGNPSLVTKVYFPREIFPFSAVIVSLVDFAVASTVLIALMLYYQIAVGWALLWLPIVLATHVAFTAAVALVLAMANLFYRDVKYLFEIAISVWMFASSALYPVDRVGGWFGVVLALNPMTQIIDAYRAVLLHAQAPSPALFATAVAAVAGLVASWIVFHAAEFKFAENI